MRTQALRGSEQVEHHLGQEGSGGQLRQRLDAGEPRAESGRALGGHESCGSKATWCKPWRAP